MGQALPCMILSNMLKSESSENFCVLACACVCHNLIPQQKSPELMSESFYALDMGMVSHYVIAVVNLFQSANIYMILCSNVNVLEQSWILLGALFLQDVYHIPFLTLGSSEYFSPLRFRCVESTVRKSSSTFLRATTLMGSGKSSGKDGGSEILGRSTSYLSSQEMEFERQLRWACLGSPWSCLQHSAP